MKQIRFLIILSLFLMVFSFVISFEKQGDIPDYYGVDLDKGYLSIPLIPHIYISNFINNSFVDGDIYFKNFGDFNYATYSNFTEGDKIIYSALDQKGYSINYVILGDGRAERVFLQDSSGHQKDLIRVIRSDSIKLVEVYTYYNHYQTYRISGSYPIVIISGFFSDGDTIYNFSGNSFFEIEVFEESSEDSFKSFCSYGDFGRFIDFYDYGKEIFTTESCLVSNSIPGYDGNSFIFSESMIYEDVCIDSSYLERNICGFNLLRWDFWNALDKVPRSREVFCEYGCSEGKCLEAIQSECVLDSDCSLNQSCIDGSCKYYNIASSCVTNNDCGNLELCVEGKCVLDLPENPNGF